ncbi:AvrD family protein [Sphingobacterium pedocola]|uniref:Avirulence D protein n=1 Tax=Sphingobacterium pedocola TaxID=2082722 RepID=A0ABR9T7R0_9SPHI|nr:AvrD family protein [Sphingobacterium pedocola]MBE8721358.1 hypothetical protein [Sphingobacterium pedocola]
MRKQFQHIDQVLGNSSVRYFAEGYRYYDIQVHEGILKDRELAGQVSFNYCGPERPRGEEVHVGSIEFTALALQLASHALYLMIGLSNEQISSAALSDLHIKLRSPQYLMATSYRVKVVSSTQSAESVPGTRSTFAITIGTQNSILIAIDHQRPYYRYLDPQQRLCLDCEQLYSSGYKNREIHIEKVNLITEQNRASAYIRSIVTEGSPMEKGIGSTRHMWLPTDALIVFGQLMQALLFTQLGIDRLRCPNIWLRQLTLASGRPIFEDHCDGAILFHDSREVNRENQKWQLISLSGTVGNYRGKFQVGFQKIES